MTKATIRTARKRHTCEGCNGGAIQPGERYIEWVCSPGHDDVGNEHWWRLHECARCAARSGRPIAHAVGGES